MKFQLLIYLLFSYQVFGESGNLNAVVPQKSWTFSSYLKSYIADDENYQRAKNNKSIAASQYMISSDLFQNTLTLQPTYLKTETIYTDSLTPDVEQSRKSLEGGLRQILPTGTEFNFEGTHFLDDVDPFLGGLNRDYRVFVEQSLWRDAFGSAARARRASANSNRESSQHAEEKVLLESCLKATEFYLSAYLGQEKRKIREDAFQESKRALSIASQGYDKRLLRKIDFLAARADYVQVQANQLQAVVEQEKSVNTLGVRASQQQDSKIKLEDPVSFFAKIMTPNEFNKETVPAYLESLAKVQSGKFNYMAIKSENRSQINLGLAAGRSTRVGATPSAPTFTDTNNDFMQVYLKLELPIINRTQDGNVGTSYYEWQTAEVEARLIEKDLRDLFLQMQVDIRRFTQELALSLENQDIKDQQFLEAKRLLKVGRIEFLDYIRYRDTLLEEKENTLNIKSNLWQSKVKLAQYGSELIQSCREAI